MSKKERRILYLKEKYFTQILNFSIQLLYYLSFIGHKKCEGMLVTKNVT